jgi:hypothetical protein
MYKFDLRSLLAALDDERRARGLSWGQLTAEINEPFENIPSIPMSVATIRDMAKKRAVASAVVLQVLRWLDRTPESFLSGRESVPHASEKLPGPAPSRILRFDTHAIYAELDAERHKRGQTWRQVADELPGFTESMLLHLASGPLIAFPGVMAVTQWLLRPAASFVRARQR